jgi:hypothetical protein
MAYIPFETVTRKPKDSSATSSHFGLTSKYIPMLPSELISLLNFNGIPTSREINLLLNITSKINAELSATRALLQGLTAKDAQTQLLIATRPFN